MATVAVIFGGVAGFISALMALAFFNAGWLLVFGTWALGGSAVSITLLLLARLRRDQMPKMIARPG